MARYDYKWSCGGCGSGTSCSYEILRDGVHLVGGTTQVGSPCTEQDKLNAILAIAHYGVSDTAFSNGIQIYPAMSGGSGSSGLILVAAAVVVFLLLRKK